MDKNKATYAVVAIATVKGICRPLFTMMDKDEDPETKKYAAIREGLTEAVAIPVYLASGKLMEKFADKLAVPKNFMDKKDILVIAILFIIVLSIATYLIVARKRGQKCIGCPYAKECAKKKSGCGCNDKK